MRYGAIVGAFVAATLLSAGLAFGEEKKIELKDMPAPVQAAVEAHARGGKVIEAELEKEDGRDIYSVEIEKDGKKTDYEFYADGKLIKSEEEKEGDQGEEEEDDDETVIELSRAPEAVQAAVKKMGAEVTTLTMEKEDGAVEYEVEYTAAGVEHSLTLAESGAVLEEESGIDKALLPPAAVKAIEKKYPGAVIRSAEQVKVVFYELDIVKNGKKHEVKLNAAGQMMDDDEDNDDNDGGKDKKDKD